MNSSDRQLSYSDSSVDSAGPSSRHLYPTPLNLDLSYSLFFLQQRGRSSFCFFGFEHVQFGSSALFALQYHVESTAAKGPEHLRRRDAFLHTTK